MIEGVNLRELRAFWLKSPKVTREELMEKFSANSINMDRWMTSAGFEQKKGIDRKIRYIPTEDVKIEEITEKIPDGLSAARQVEHLLDRGYSIFSICLHKNILYKTVNDILKDIQLARANEYNQNKDNYHELGDPIPKTAQLDTSGSHDQSDLAHPKMKTVYDYKTCECMGAVIFRKMMEVSSVEHFDCKVFQDGMDNVNVPVSNAFLRDIGELANVPCTGDSVFDLLLLKFAASQRIGFNVYKFLYDDVRRELERKRPFLSKISRKNSDKDSE